MLNYLTDTTLYKITDRAVLGSKYLDNHILHKYRPENEKDGRAVQFGGGAGGGRDKSKRMKS